MRRTVRIVLKATVVVVILLLLTLAIAWIRSVPAPLPAGSESAARRAPGPRGVGKVDLEWVDPSRPTPANGDFAGAPERRFAVTLWYPKEDAAPHPLLVYSHGFMSNRHGGRYLAEHLASYGYVVVAADFPLSNGDAPGGANFADVINQPADVSFLIDQALALTGDARPFAGELDRARVGALGLSLGGLTTTLVVAHPEMRDPRIRAAVSIAGPGDIFGRDYFAAAPPLLMIAGTADEIVDYEENAAPIPARLREGGLLTIAGATHVGFTHVATGFLRVFRSADAFICSLSKDNFEARVHPFAGRFGGPELGLVEPPTFTPACTKELTATVTPKRQQDVTAVAAHAFFAGLFDADEGARAEHRRFLHETLPAELDDVRFTPAAGGM
jgi:predicted dienelactone hydrolase